MLPVRCPNALHRVKVHEGGAVSRYYRACCRRFLGSLLPRLSAWLGPHISRFQGPSLSVRFAAPPMQLFRKFLVSSLNCLDHSRPPSNLTGANVMRLGTWVMPAYPSFCSSLTFFCTSVCTYTDWICSRRVWLRPGFHAHVLGGVQHLRRRTFHV